MKHINQRSEQLIRHIIKDMGESQLMRYHSRNLSQEVLQIERVSLIDVGIKGEAVLYILSHQKKMPDDPQMNILVFYDRIIPVSYHCLPAQIREISVFLRGHAEPKIDTKLQKQHVEFLHAWLWESTKDFFPHWTVNRSSLHSKTNHHHGK